MMELQPFTAEREWTVDGVPVLSAAISVPDPIPATGKIPRRIQRYYQLLCRSYLHYCETMLLPQAETEYRAALAASTPLPSFRAELNYHITYHEDHFLSLYTQSREMMGRQTLVTRRADTWDLTSGYPVPLSDFFPPRSSWKRQLLKLASEEIQRQEQAGISRYHETWSKELRRRFNSQNYYLTPEGLVFFFPMYAIAPAAEGIPTFVFPYGQDQQPLSFSSRTPRHKKKPETD